MVHWWEVDLPDADAPALVRAVAYYRHSAQDRQENSIPIQQDQVRAWANQHGVEIIREFCDAGRSGLNSEDRPAFMEMMDEWIAKRKDFEYVLCLDVSRWGRFQDIDLSAQFSAICKKNKKQVIYTTIGKPKENDPLYPVSFCGRVLERIRFARLGISKTVRLRTRQGSRRGSGTNKQPRSRDDGLFRLPGSRPEVDGLDSASGTGATRIRIVLAAAARYAICDRYDAWRPSFRAGRPQNPRVHCNAKVRIGFTANSIH